VVAPKDGVLSDLEIYQTLAKRLGFGEVLAGTALQWIDRLLSSQASNGATRKRLLEGALAQAGSTSVAYAGRRFPTPSGKFRFLERHVESPPADPSYPLQLMAGSTRRWQTSQLTAEEERSLGPLEVTVHPSSAEGIEDGAPALLESRLGSLAVRVRHDRAYRRDMAYVPRARSHQLGRCVNALIRPLLTDLGESSALLDEWVRLRPAEDQRTKEPR
jgi:predicted molibdopterin-dependent oxidoreductase YjgC